MVVLKRNEIEHLKHYAIHKTTFPLVNGENSTLKTMTSMDYEMKLLTTDLKDC